MGFCPPPTASNRMFLLSAWHAHLPWPHPQALMAPLESSFLLEASACPHPPRLCLDSGPGSHHSTGHTTSMTSPERLVSVHRYITSAWNTHLQCLTHGGTPTKDFHFFLVLRGKKNNPDLTFSCLNILSSSISWPMESPKDT